MHPATVLVIHPWSFLRILKDILLRLHAVYLCYLASNSPPPLIRKLWAVAELNRLTLTRLLLNKLLCGALDLSRIVCMSTSFTSHYHKLLASQASPMPINCARLSGLSSLRSTGTRCVLVEIARPVRPYAKPGRVKLSVNLFFFLLKKNTRERIDFFNSVSPLRHCRLLNLNHF